MSDDKEFMFTGTVALSGVTFFVTAANEQEAKAKAKAGDWDHYETDAAECIDATPNIESCEVNE